MCCSKSLTLTNSKKCKRQACASQIAVLEQTNKNIFWQFRKEQMIHDMMYKIRITLWSVERLVLGEWQYHPEINFANLGENSLGLEKSQNYLD